MWHWEAPHPDWKPGEDWGQTVSSYAIDDGRRFLLLDPLAPPDLVYELAAERETAIVLTTPWHARDGETLAERLDVPLYVPPPDEGDPNPVKGHIFRAGERLPVGVEVFPGMEPNDIVLCHDGGGNRTETVRALRHVLPEWKHRGYITIPLIVPANDLNNPPPSSPPPTQSPIVSPSTDPSGTTGATPSP